MKKIFQHMLFMITILSLCLVLATITAYAFGLRSFILATDSMRPLYHRGSLILIDTNTDPEKITVGEIVAFYPSDNDPFLHRVIKVNQDRSRCTLKGDCNKTTESVNLRTSLIGKAVMAIPFAGTIIEVFRQRKWIPVMIISILIIASFLSSEHIRDFLRKRKQKVR